MSRRRYRNPQGHSDLTVAVDEIYTLRSVCAAVAHQLGDDLKLASFPKSRRRSAEQARVLLRDAARGDSVHVEESKARLKDVGAPEGLTNEAWAEGAGLSFVEGLQRVLDDVEAERHRQVDLGWTREHDDTHDLPTMVSFAEEYTGQLGAIHLSTARGWRAWNRTRLIKAIALLVALAEKLDREDARDTA